MTSRSLSLRALLAASAACVTLQVGCAAFSVPGTSLQQVAGVPGSAQPSPGLPPASAVTVEMRKAKTEKSEIRQVPLQGPMFLQEALEASGATKRFRGMNIEVIRLTGDEPQKMDAKYNRGKGRVEFAYDYALRPGDRLIVTEDSTTALEQMVRSLAGPLAGAVGK